MIWMWNLHENWLFETTKISTRFVGRERDFPFRMPLVNTQNLIGNQSKSFCARNRIRLTPIGKHGTRLAAMMALRGESKLHQRSQSSRDSVSATRNLGGEIPEFGLCTPSIVNRSLGNFPLSRLGSPPEDELSLVGVCKGQTCSGHTEACWKVPLWSCGNAHG